ncbi:hypothetical protein ACWDBP_34960 [Streptomyces sp. NPDC001233]|uniref:hypothetical protein n=1 Tax=Streptomyces sp. NPDC002589 TaxID=3154420 RepID=UPI0033342EA4
MPSTEELIAIKEQVEQQFLDQPGVTGVDVGYKWVGGQRTDQLAVRIHVERKTDDIPPEQRVPPEINGALTDVLERKYELHVMARPLEVTLQADTAHYSPLEGGISMGPSRVIGGSVYAGTLGAIVIDNSTQKRVALTNFHVAAVDDAWAVGNRMVQPSQIDTGTVPSDEFGAILRATLSAAVDGAVISIDSSKMTSCEVVDIGMVQGTKNAVLGMAVRKRGRTTGLTYGSVDGIAASVTVDYGDNLGQRTLSNQVSIAADTSRNTTFSDHGDSGSVIVDDSGNVVALLFAGSGSNTVGNPITDVLTELGISMCIGKPMIKNVKERHKDVAKDKDGLKDLKDYAKEKEIIREGLLNPEFPAGLPGLSGGRASLELRLSAVEAQLAQLGNFIQPDERPDLRGTAFALSEEQTEMMRAELERQVAEAMAAKTAFDTPPA